MTKNRKTPSPPLLKILAALLFLFGLFAFTGSTFLWGEGFILQAPAGTDLTFPIVDIFVNAPASILAAIGLWKLKEWGYVASQFVAGFYVYASGIIFVEIAQSSQPFEPEIIIPQVLAVMVAIGLVFYLWSIRHLFH